MKNKSCLFLLVLGFACSGPTAESGLKQVPVYTIQDEFIQRYSGTTDNGDRLDFILINWADGTLNGFLNRPNTTSFVRLVGESNLDESVNMYSTRDSSSHRLSFPFPEDCTIKGRITDQGLQNEQEFHFECQPSTFERLNGAYSLADSARQLNLNFYRNSEYQLYFAIRENSQQKDVKLVGNVLLEKQEWRSQSSFNEKGDELDCSFVLKNVRANGFTIELKDSSCDFNFNGDFLKKE